MISPRFACIIGGRLVKLEIDLFSLKELKGSEMFHASPYLIIHSITSNEKFLSNYHPKLYKVCKHHSCVVSKRHNIEAFYANAGGFLGFVVCLLVCFCLKLHQFWHAVAIISFKFNEANEQWFGNRKLK